MIFRRWVHAEPETVWNVLLDGVENPQKYMADVTESRVMERFEGGMVKKLMLEGNENAAGIYDFFVFERGTLKEIKPLGDENVTGVFDCFVFEDGIIREIKVRGTTYRERISVSRERREIRRELIDHPACGGRITVMAVPSSVQNPMAPTDLQFFLKLEAKLSRAEGMAKWEDEMTVDIREEQQRLKDKAEEFERKAC